jgi:hypothetical protein
VRGEGQLDAICGPGPLAGHDTGIVHQHIQALLVLAEPAGKCLQRG